jgi:hypothetical protein
VRIPKHRDQRSELIGTADPLGRIKLKTGLADGGPSLTA